MIIKIKIDETLKVGGILPHPSGWWIEDDIAKIKITKILVQSRQPADSRSSYSFFPYPESFPKNNEPDEDAIQLMCVMKDGSERVIVFQGTAFLLNDEGKTIEKLVS